MRALTISQPYAELIASGEKWVENRTWKPPARMIGERLAIHAGSGTQYLTRTQLAEYVTGGLVAVATLVAVVTAEDMVRWIGRAKEADATRIADSSRTFGDLARHQHAEGPVCWVLDDVQRLPECVPMPGAQGLWEANFVDPFAAVA